MTPYLQPDLIARAEALGLKARTVVEGLHVGEHRSPYRGFSVEFVQHRPYAPGDELRHIDWKVYGRSDRYTIKQYEQDTNFICHLLLDASRSMVYGEGETNKLEYAKVLAATLAYLCVSQRDSAGLDVFDSSWRLQVPPSSQPGHIQAILHALESTEPHEKTSIGPLLHQLAERVRRRGLIFLISDCLDEVESLLEGIRHLRFEGHDVTVFHVLHSDELRFPFDGIVQFENVEGPDQLLTRSEEVRKAYLEALQSFRTGLETGCEAHRCDYVLMDTSRPLTEALSEYLAKRLRIRRV